MNHNQFVFTRSKRIFLFTAAVLFAACPVFAQPLSEAEKAQKREELDRAFTAALSQASPTAKQARQALQATINGSTRYGYDNNVDLSKARDGDSFYQEQAGGLLKYDPSREILGAPVTLGVLGDYDYLGYFDRDDLDRQTGIASPFIQLELNRSLMLEGGYEFRVQNYGSRDDLNYLSHAAEIKLRHRLTASLTQKGEFRYERLGYSDRKQLQPNGNFGGEERSDGRYTTLYGLRYRSGPLTFRLEGAWMRNDSNDQYFDYNDYNDFGLDGSAGVRIAERWVLTGFGGWHKRSFDERAPILGSSITQEDDWYYVGGRIFFALNTWSGFDITTTYSSNNSNDPNRDYWDLLTSAGYHLYF